MIAFFKYLRWRFNHAHQYKKIASDTWACQAKCPHDGTICGAWYGEQAWS